jgi:hypothetical protein
LSFDIGFAEYLSMPIFHYFSIRAFHDSCSIMYLAERLIAEC